MRVSHCYRIEEKKEKGLSLLEIIVSMAILMLLATTTVGVLIAYRDRQVLNTETTQVLSMFNKARTETLASKLQLSYGVRLNADRVILYPTAFASSTAENEEYVLHHSVIISDISLNGGGLDCLFNRLSGDAPSYGTFRVSLASDPNQFHTITIKQTGFIGLQD
jgi:type II secretory pathway pseudopilin PulG